MLRSTAVLMNFCFFNLQTNLKRSTYRPVPSCRRMKLENSPGPRARNGLYLGQWYEVAHGSRTLIKIENVTLNTESILRMVSSESSCRSWCHDIDKTR